MAQFPHSGQDSPNLYGDYEAQRHWMEITTNLPVTEWYKNSTDNDLLYWGLDYPPITAYHMYILGRIANYFNGSWTELHKSRGIETYEHKIFMRMTVLSADILIYMTAIIYYFYQTQPLYYASPPSNSHKQNVAIYTALVLMYPGQILIDHGHFQYNCVFMGLTLWAIILMSKEHKVASAVIFTLALCYKQMSLYYSLPFFWFIVATTLREGSLFRIVSRIILFGLIVSSTFAIVFLPYLKNSQDFLQVLHRIFPFARGLFEDKVGNFWFTLNIFYKIREFYSTNELLKISTVTTLLVSLPVGLHILFKPTLRTFKYAIVNTSLAFFLLSFQVHEKTILVPALPVLLFYREHPMIVNWFAIVSTFSLQPLLHRDGQLVPYLVLMIMFTLISIEMFSRHISLDLSKLFSLNNLIIAAYFSSILGCFSLSVAAIFVKPPQHLPDLHPTLNALYSCLHFTYFLIFFYYKQFSGDGKKNQAPERVYLLKKIN